jgi:membrane-associated phospholipid phosphatase
MDGPDPTFTEAYKNYGDVGNIKSWLYDWKGANEWLFLKINYLHASWYDSLMQLITFIGDRHNFPYYLGIALVGMVLCVAVRKIQGHAGTRQYITQWVGVMLVLLAGFLVVEESVHLLKEYFAYPRPYIALGENNVTLVEHRPAGDDNHSFPSGHVAFITMMMVSLWPVLSKNFRTFGGWLIFAVAWSRMALGVHFPADVLSGYLVALCLVLMVRSFIYFVLRRLFRLNCG